MGLKCQSIAERGIVEKHSNNTAFFSLPELSGKQLCYMEQNTEMCLSKSLKMCHGVRKKHLCVREKRVHFM